MEETSKAPRVVPTQACTTGQTAGEAWQPAGSEAARECLVDAAAITALVIDEDRSQEELLDLRVWELNQMIASRLNDSIAEVFSGESRRGRRS